MANRGAVLDWLTIILMLGAALVHASWHAIVKSVPSRVALLAGMGIAASAIAVCVLPFVPFPSATTWAVIAVSVVLHVGYKFALVKAYSFADLGQAFPLARGLVPLFATAIAFMLLGELPSVPQAAGIGMVSAGLLWMAYDAIRHGIDKRIFAATCAAGFAVASYSALDAYGTRLMGDWAGFTAWLIVVDSCVFLIFAHVMQGQKLWLDLWRFRYSVLVAGLLGTASFAILLWSLSRAPIGLVMALRESSVLFATFIGIAFFSDRATFVRIGASTVIMIGLVLSAGSR